MNQDMKNHSFDKLNNTRDIGGMMTLDKRQIVRGKLFRSGQLNDLSASDRNKLTQLDPIIIDFRTDTERYERPDVQMDGIETVHIPIVDDLTAGISRESGSIEEIFRKFILNPEQARQYMCEMYRNFASDNSVSKYTEFVRIIIQSEKPVLWHCTAGKDRAGIGAVIVEEILGVSKEDIISDYLSTNEFIKNDVKFITELLKKKIGTTDERADESLGLLLGAKKEYIDSFYQAVNDKYGSMDGYIRNGLAVLDEEIRIMKNKYLT